MQTVGLLRLAAEAEALRIRRGVSSGVHRLAMTAAAALFSLAALGLLHLAAWIALVPEIGAAQAALVLAAADIMLALILFLLARPRRDPIAAEAAALRSAMLMQAMSGASLGATVKGLTLRTPVAVLGGLLAETAFAAFRRR